MNRLGLRISELFYLFLTLSTGTVFVLNSSASLPYMLCCVILALPLILTSTRHPYRYFILFASTALYMAYLVRPMVLLTDLDIYKYNRLASVSLPDVIERMWGLVPLFAFFLVGIMIPLLLLKPIEKSVSSANETSSDLLLDNAKWISVVAWVSLITTLGLAIFFNIGLKNVASSAPHLQFISRFTPTLLMIASSLTLLVLYRDKISPSTFYLIIGFLISIGCFELLIRGSKAGLAVVFFSWFVVQVAKKNDFSIRPQGVIAITVGFVVCCMVAFSLSNKVRYASTSGGLFGRAASALSNYSDEVSLAKSADDFTGRMCGFDGQLVVQQSRPVGLRKSFQTKNIIRNTIARVVPGMAPGSMTTGKAIAVYYQGAKKSSKFSGGVGLFGSLTLISYGREWINALLFGMGIAFVFRILVCVRDEGVGIVLQTAFFYYFIQMVISGGIGFAIGNFVVVLGQAFGLLSLGHLTRRRTEHVEIGTPAWNTNALS